MTHAQPIRPLYLVPRYWPGLGGSELHSRELVQTLADYAEPSVIRICSEESVATDLAYGHVRSQWMLDRDTEIIQLGAEGQLKPILKSLAGLGENNRFARKAFSLLARCQLRQQIRSIANRHHVAHAIYNGFTPLAEAASDQSIPFVWTPLAHTENKAGTAWQSRGFRSLYQRADALIAMTDYEADWLVNQGVMTNKVHVVPMAPLLADTPPDPSGFRRKWDLGENPCVLFLGRLSEAKGYHAIIKAAETVWRDHPDTHFVFVGPGHPPVSHKVDPRIIFTGLIEDDEKNSALAACDMLCVPSTQESLGVVYLEAWTFSKPVIAADIPVMHSVISDGEDGLLVRPTDTSIADAILNLLNDPAWADAMGQAGRLKVTSQYNWQTSAGKLHDLYKALI